MTTQRVVLISRDLLFGSIIAGAAERRGIPFSQIDEPANLLPPASVRMVFVDWGERRPGWAETLTDWRQRTPESRRPTIVLFGPHTDLSAHADARAAGLGPMWARSRLRAEVAALLER